MPLVGLGARPPVWSMNQTLRVQSSDRPIWEVIGDIMKDVLDEVFDRLPKDGASQVDHYIYGVPKKGLVDRVFADTFYWVALIHRKDAKNKAVLEWSRAAASVTLFTTEEVLTEVLAFCSADEELRTKAVKTVRSILVARTVHVFASLREKKRISRKDAKDAKNGVASGRRASPCHSGTPRGPKS